MIDPDGDERRAPWRWFHDEEFWRDITKNVLTFSITGALAFLVAVLGGYIRRPDTRLYVFVVIAFLFVAVAVRHLYKWLLQRYGRKGVNVASEVLQIIGLVGVAIATFGPLIVQFFKDKF